MPDYPIHFVCTHDEAKALLPQQEKFWVSNCGCREGKGTCSQSRMDVCLIFKGDIGSSGSTIKEVDRAFVEGIFKEAEDKLLVARPYRNDTDKNTVDGLCFCCNDCCGYFLDPTETCDKGKFIEKTDMDACIDCGECVPVCYFKARKMAERHLEVDRQKCYGCGLCASVCPIECIEMIER